MTTERQPLPRLGDLPGKRATRQLVLEAARRVDEIDSDHFDFGDGLGLNIAYDQLRMIARKHGRDG